MSERRLLAVLGFILALLGGILVLFGALSPPGNRGIDLEYVVGVVVDVVLGIAAILAGILMYRGRMSAGGLVTIVIGVLIYIFGGGLLAAALVIVGGILGILGAELRSSP